MYLVHLFKYRLRSLLLTLPILHYSLPVNSLLFVPVLLHCPFFCHMTSATQSSPDLLRLLISSSTLSVPHEFGMTVSFSLGVLHFPQDSHLPQDPWYKTLSAHTRDCLTHCIMYLSSPDPDTLACGASPVTCGGLLYHMSMGTDILPTC